MEMNIIEQKKNRFQASFPGADHTVCNAVVNELWADKSVKAAAYTIDHPLVGKPKLFVETDGKDAISAITDSCKRLKKMNAELLKSIDKN